MKNYLSWVVAFSLLLLLTISTTPVLGQRSSKNMAPVTSTYALTGVNVVTSPGNMIENVTVIIKNGLIHNIGKGISIPGEAEVIAADSMYVYAGFISALSHAGIKSEERAPSSGGGRGQQRPSVDPVNPPNKVAGILPERMVKDVLDPEEKSIEDMRNAGFTATQAVPKGGMFPGSGAVVLLSGKSADAMIIKDNTAMFSQLVGGPRVYPATVIGVMAKWRELYRQAGYAMKHEAAYTAQSNGTKRPSYNRTLQAFYPVIEKKQSVFIKTEKMLDAYRAMTLQRDLGFNLVLTELKEGWDLTEKIKSQNAKVLLSMTLPKAEKKKGDDKKGKDDAKKSEEKEKEISPLEQEKVELEKRKTAAIKQYNSQAATFEKAGIEFGFSTIKTKPSTVLSQVRVMIEHGLSEDGALKALTTTPASMLGVSNLMGTVEKGKMANLVVADKPVFDKESNIRYVFVDGNKYAMKVKSKAKKSTESKGALGMVVGTWEYETETPQGNRKGVLNLKNEDGSLVGDVSAEGMPGSMDLSSASFDGKVLTFSFTIDMGGESMTIDVEANVDGETFDATMSVGEFGSFPMEGKRTEKPE